MALTVSVDIGGTFTDLTVFDSDTGRVAFAKSSTTPRDLSRGILDCLQKAGVNPSECRYFKHGTTVVINALLERKGANTALVTTRGFRDVAELGRATRPEPFNLFYQRNPPLVPRPLRFEVTERMDAQGQPVTPLDQKDLAEVVQQLKAAGVESVAVCFLHAYRNPEHEQAAGEALAEAGVFVSLSHDLSREWREYERTSTTIANAFVGPLVSHYVGKLEASLTGMGFQGRLLLMESNGGVMSAETGRHKPILMVESGPVAGCVGALEIGRLLNQPNVIAFDMGGTTAKCALIQNARLNVESTYYIGGYEQGVPVQAAVVDILEIGAGGGSVAWLDDYRSLQIGPRSAGAEPGPVCYSKGGTEPTITDMHLALGHLDPQRFLGGEMPLDREASLEAIRTQLAEPLGADVYHIAAGVVQIADVKMANVIKKMSLEKGADPRDFALVAYGGNGPLHATTLARELSIPHVIIPPMPAHFSALGMLLADLRHDLAYTLVSPLDHLSSEAMEEAFQGLEEKAGEQIRQSMPEVTEIRMLRTIELRYKGQEHALRVPVPSLSGGRLDLAALRTAFDQLYEQRFGRSEPLSPVEVIGLKLTAEGVIAKPDLRTVALDARGTQTDEYRPVYDARAGRFSDFRVVRREALSEGAVVEGPAVIQEEASTTLLFPGDQARVAEFGILSVTIGGL